MIELSETQACRNLWAEVLHNALKMAKEAPKEVERTQHRRFISERAGTFDWICEQLDLDPSETSKRMITAIEP